MFGEVEAKISGPRTKVKRNMVNAAKSLRKSSKGRKNINAEVSKLEGVQELDLFSQAANKVDKPAPVSKGDMELDLFSNDRLRNGNSGGTSENGTPGNKQSDQSGTDRGTPSQGDEASGGREQRTGQSGSERGGGIRGEQDRGSDRTLDTSGREQGERNDSPGEASRPERQPSRTPIIDRAALAEDDRNAVIDPTKTIAPKSIKAKADANFKAMELLLSLEEEGRNPTTEEKATLLAYTGWGAMPQAFDEEMADNVENWKDTHAWNRESPDQYIIQAKAWEKKWGSHYAKLRELMSEEDIKAAKRSTLNAHFTTPAIIDGIWSVLRHLGFYGGRALEPGAGIGHFIGTQPKDLAERTEWTGVELDHFTARILSKLYPEARINSMDGAQPGRHVEGEGFQEAIIPNNSQDVVVSNIPFAKTGPWQGVKQHGVDFNLHNYFFAQALDKVRPGGVVAFITTSNTMESAMKQRKALAGKGELIGAVRLPNTAFKENAGTEVTTDVIFIRKPDGKKSPANPQSWVNRVDIGHDTVTHNAFPRQNSWDNPTKAEFHDAMTGIDMSWEPVDPALAEAWNNWKVGRAKSGINYEALRSSWRKATKQENEHGRVTYWNAKVEFKAPIRVNEYFAKHPENVLGEHALSGSMYSNNEYTVKDNGTNLREGFDRFAASLPKNVMDQSLVETGAKPRMAEKTDEPGDYVEKDGIIYKVEGGALVPAEWANDPATVQVYNDWKKVADTTIDLLRAEQSGMKEDAIEALRARLNRLYDAHVKKYGAINKGTKTNKHVPFMDAPRFVITQALENEVKVVRGVTKRNFTEYQKAEIFSKRMNRPYEVPTTAESIEDAVTTSLTWVGAIDVPFIANLLGDDVAKIKEDILEKGLAFVNPESGLLESPDSYLSGSVRLKLDKAIESAKTNPEYQSNVDALTEALPEPIKISNIEAVLGAQWVPAEVVAKFAETEMGIDGAQIEFIPGLNTFEVKGSGTGGKYSTNKLTPQAILKAALNSKVIYLSQSDGQGGTVRDEKGIALGNATVERLKMDFRRWVKKTNEAVEGKTVPSIIEESFNRSKNGFVKPTFKGEHITLPGASDTVYRTDIRKAAIARLLSQGGGMIAHGVGFGKTFTLIGLAMELKRLGKANKPMIAVQNSTARQFASAIKQAYPGAKVLIADDKTFTQQNRRKFTAKMATGDWDIILVAHSQINLIPSSKEAVDAYMDEQTAELKEAINIASATKQSKKTVKDLEKQLSALEEKRKKMLAQLADRQDSALTFEEIGVDALLVDEAHMFKNTPLVTKKANIKGIKNGESQRAINMSIKTQSIQSKRNGQGVFFATGTPVTNTMAEAYTMMKYVSPKLLIDAGITSFDEFANTYGDTKTSVEPTWKGNLEPVTRFSQFVNGQALINLVRSSWDVEMSAEKAGMKRPEVKGGKPELVITEKTPVMEAWNMWLVATAKEFKNVTRKERDETPWLNAIPISIMQAGAAAALDPRMIHPEAGDHADSKLNTAVGRIAEIYEKGHDKKTTQIVFTDLGKSFNMSMLETYADNPFGDNLQSHEYESGEENPNNNPFVFMDELVRKLEEKGIAKHEIGIVTGKTSRNERNTIFEKVQSGAIRVVIGSTETLGVGVNVQDRLAAAHNLMPPRSFKPSDMEQRIGRILRQGNLHYDWKQEIEILNYGVEGSLDSAIYSMMAKKQNFIAQILMGEIKGHRFDDPGDAVAMGMEEMAALTAGDPDLIRLIEINNKLKTLELEEEGFIDSLSSVRNRYQYAVNSLENKGRDMELAGEAETLVADLKDLPENHKPVYRMDGETLDRNPPKDKPKGWKPQALTGFLVKHLGAWQKDIEARNAQSEHTINIDGLTYIVKQEARWKGAQNEDGLSGYIYLERNRASRESFSSPRGFMSAVEQILDKTQNATARVKGRYVQIERDSKSAKAQLDTMTWDGTEEIDALRQERVEVLGRLNGKEESTKEVLNNYLGEGVGRDGMQQPMLEAGASQPVLYDSETDFKKILVDKYGETVPIYHVNRYNEKFDRLESQYLNRANKNGIYFSVGTPSYAGGKSSVYKYEVPVDYLVEHSEPDYEDAEFADDAEFEETFGESADGVDYESRALSSWMYQLKGDPTGMQIIFQDFEGGNFQMNESYLVDVKPSSAYLEAGSSLEIDQKERMEYYESRGVKPTSEVREKDGDLFAWAGGTEQYQVVEDGPKRDVEQEHRKLQDKLAIFLQDPSKAEKYRKEIVEALEEGKALDPWLKDVFTHQDSWNPVGTKINTEKEAFHAFASMRNPFIESLRVMVLDDKNQVVHAEVLTVGTLDSSIAQGCSPGISGGKLQHKKGGEAYESYFCSQSSEWRSYTFTGG